APPRAQMVAREIACARDDRALLVLGIDIELLAEAIERDHRQLARVIAEPSVLASARQAAHQDHVGAKRFVRPIERIVRGTAQIKDARVIRRKRERRAQASDLVALLAEERDVVEEAL